jgi:hypothetical protein
MLVLRESTARRHGIRVCKAATSAAIRLGHTALGESEKASGGGVKGVAIAVRGLSYSV